MGTHPSIAIVTMSHVSDLHRCELLLRTIDRCVSPRVPHYIVVDRRDRKKFAHLQSRHTTILCVEDILPWWVFRLPIVGGVWFSLKTPPFRDWILQQVVKLAMATKIDEQVFIHIDTDVAFVRPFDPRSHIRGERVRLYRVPGASSTNQTSWHRTVGPLVGLTRLDYYGASYVGNLITWRRDNVFRLHRRIETISNRGWLETVCMPKNWNLAEYLLYGVFIDHVVGEAASGHWYDAANPCLGYWERNPLNETQIRHLMGKLEPQHVAVMIASYAGVSASTYAHIIDEFTE